MKDRPTLLVITGWFCFGISLFLPALPFMGTPIPGWEAALFSLAMLSEVPEEFEHVYLQLVALTNVMMILSPVLLWLKKHRQCAFCSIAMLIATILAGSLFVFYQAWTGGLLYGYYVWLLSFSFVTIGLIKLVPRPQG